MAELHSCYRRPLLIQERKKERKKASALILPLVACRLLFLCALPAGSSSSVHFGWELPDIRSRQEFHHHFIALLHGEQLRDLYVLAPARSPSRCFPHIFPERLLLVSPWAAVAEEMLPHQGYRAASATAPSAFVVFTVSNCCRYIPTGACLDFSR